MNNFLYVNFKLLTYCSVHGLLLLINFCACFILFPLVNFVSSGLTRCVRFIALHGILCVLSRSHDINFSLNVQRGSY